MTRNGLICYCDDFSADVPLICEPRSWIPSPAAFVRSQSLSNLGLTCNRRLLLNNRFYSFFHGDDWGRERNLRKFDLHAIVGNNEVGSHIGFCRPFFNCCSKRSLQFLLRFLNPPLRQNAVRQKRVEVSFIQSIAVSQKVGCCSFCGDLFGIWVITRK